MSLVPSLLQAIVTTDGEALVLHVGEKPYVVTPTGQVDLATRGLTFDAVNGIVNELLPIESQRALDEFGAAQFELPPIVEFPGECFTVVAARGGDDLWAEIRRKSVPDEDRVPLELFRPPAKATPGPTPEPPRPVVARPAAPASQPAVKPPPIPPSAPTAPAEAVASVAAKPQPAPPAPPASTPPAPAPAAAQSAPAVAQSAPVAASAPSVLLRVPPPAPPPSPPPVPASVATTIPQRPVAPPPPVAVTPPAPVAPTVTAPPPPAPQTAAIPPAVAARPPVVVSAPPPVAAAPPSVVAPPPVVAPPVSDAGPVFRPAGEPVLKTGPTSVVAAPPPVVAAPPPVVPTPPPVVSAAPPAPVPPVAPLTPPFAGPSTVQRPSTIEPPPSFTQPAVVLPLARSPIRPEGPPRVASDALAGLDTLLRVAVARGASTLYLSSGARPSMRVDGDVLSIEGAPVLGPNDVEALVLTLMPERNAESLRSGVASEWICDVPDVGRVRCMSFRDHRGPGGVFRLMPSRATTADQLGLSREIQALATEQEGLLLVAGPRSSGKRTLITGFVDLVNKARRDHVITIEREITSVHERTGSFISQREVRGGTEEMLEVARAALREDPDVLVLEELRTPGLINLALDAAASGQLVIGGFPAPNAPGAIDRIIDLYPPEHRRAVQLSLAQNLRGVVAQVLLKKTSGGRVAAREVLLNTAAVRSVLAEGKTSQLPLAIEGGRPFGMAPLNDALVGYVLNGYVDIREAYHYAVDRSGLLTMLKRHGFDTSLIERPA